ncbi:MAG: 23S rRNA (adenine(2503)-C(2))-methyltransferase RlmN [Bacteriovoracaceae bacterium]
MVSVYSMTSQNWKDFLLSQGASISTLPFWLDGLYRNSAIMEKHISPAFLQHARENFSFVLPEITRTQEAADGTTKFQMKMSDGLEVETVLLPFHKRFTVCLSTQVGCGMNCSFCYTGTMGLRRNLTAGEIVGQYLSARKFLREKDKKALTPSIVFMGQGEPLHNATEVKKAIQILNDPKMGDVGVRQMTLSTVGLLPALDELKDFPRINLALSLHSPFDEEREQLIPVNQKWPLKNVIEKLDEVPLLPRQFITFEYLLIKDFNMSTRHADALADLLGKRKALVNLIPMNPFPGAKWERPEAEAIEAFKAELVKRKLRVMVRGTKGDDILAACGQLRVEKSARRKSHDN